jgi:hypothetical protein
MNLYWDASALLSLVFQEPSSDSARQAYSISSLDVGWRWLAVEATSGAIRRRASSSQWACLEELLAGIQYVDLEAEEVPSLCRANRDWGLRAADAGHVYVFKKISAMIPDLELVCFDREMRVVVKRLHLPLWGEAGGMAGHQLRERRATYGRRKKRGKS